MSTAAVACGVLVLLGATAAGAGWVGYGAGRDAEIAKRSSDEDIRRETRELAQQGAADAIAKNRPKNVTIQQRLETEVRTREVFRDCRSGPGPVELLNATPGVAPGRAEPPGGGQLPASGAARG